MRKGTHPLAQAKRGRNRAAELWQATEAREWKKQLQIWGYRNKVVEVLSVFGVAVSNWQLWRRRMDVSFADDSKFLEGWLYSVSFPQIAVLEH